MQTLMSQMQTGKAQPVYEHGGPASRTVGKISTKHLFSYQLGPFPGLGCSVDSPQLALASLFISLCLLHLYTELKYNLMLLEQGRGCSPAGSEFHVSGSLHVAGIRMCTPWRLCSNSTCGSSLSQLCPGCSTRISCCVVRRWMQMRER